MTVNNANTPWLIYFLSKSTAEVRKEDYKKQISRSQLGFKLFGEVTLSNTEVITYLGSEMLP